MRLQILSDIHLECASFIPPNTTADVVLLAGDIGVGDEGIKWAREVFDVPVIYVAGNHEYHKTSYTMSEIMEKMIDSASGSHVAFLDNEVRVINGVRFIGTTM